MARTSPAMTIMSILVCRPLWPEHTKKRPRILGGASRFLCSGSGSLLLRDFFVLRGNGHLLRRPGADLHFARLCCFRNFPGEIDMQHAIDKACSDDLDVVGEAEAPLE